jgi:hypothetical protein
MTLQLLDSTFEEYYRPTVVTIMVPVKVSYHEATDTVYSWEPPTLTLEAVEKAVKEQT